MVRTPPAKYGRAGIIFGRARILWARHTWHEVTKVQHYYLSVDAMTQPMRLREEQSGYVA